MTETSAHKSKPCPFCGSDDGLPSMHVQGKETLIAWSCDNCGAEGPFVRAIHSDRTADIRCAIRLWNKRADTAVGSES